MAYCCVPLCRSHSKSKLPGISFHEIPADETLRQQWIKAIRRDDWEPNTNSNYSRVCSRHFRQTEFIEGKRRRLKKGAVPSVFPEYPAYLRPQPLKERSSENIRKRSTPQSTDKENGPLQKKKKRLDDEEKQERIPDVDQPSSEDSELEHHQQGIPAADINQPCREELTKQTPGSDEAAIEICMSSHDSLHVSHKDVDKATQVDVGVSSLLATERTKWKRKERDLKRQIDRLRETTDRYKEELNKMKSDCHFGDLQYIREQAKEKHLPAIFLWDQIVNFKRKKPVWSEDVIRHCIILRHLSTKAYEHARKEMLLKLPSRSTLQNYIGSSSAETGFNSLIQARLKVELEKLEVPQSRVCSLIVDEMRIKPKLLYNKQQDCFVGHVDMGVANETASEPVLANSLLCFVINGLSTAYRIPVAYYFTKGLDGKQLSTLIRYVMKKVEEAGFTILRFVSDNHKVNVSAMKHLCGGFLTYRIEHPCDPERLLFLSFDYCHVLKNIRSQFLARELGENGEVSSTYLKKLYEMQKGWLVKPVRCLTRKHVYPNNIEKMNVIRAVEVFSLDVTSALEFLKEQAGHGSHPSFAFAGPAIVFMKNIFRWFTLHDTSNKVQHIHQRFPDTRHFDNCDDDRLEWLNVTFPLYIEDLKKKSTSPRGFLTTETYEALLLTTYSTAACVRHLLVTEKFSFVLTRKFSSDPIEALFGTLRRSLGCNDQLDVRSAMSGLEKLLKTGIAAASESSNVLHNERPELRKGILVNAPVTSGSSVKLPPEAGLVLERLKIARVPASLPTLQLSATVYVGGYIARVIREHVTCDSCYSLMSKPLSYQPLQQLTRNQDRGGLLYPSDQLVYVLDILRLFVETALKKAPKLEKPLRTLQEAAVPAIVDCGLLNCPQNDRLHHQDLVQLICVKFIRPLLVNYASAATDRIDIYKSFAQKPLSRKYVKL